MLSLTRAQGVAAINMKACAHQCSIARVVVPIISSNNHLLVGKRIKQNMCMGLCCAAEFKHELQGKKDFS